MEFLNSNNSTFGVTFGVGWHTQCQRSNSFISLFCNMIKTSFWEHYLEKLMITKFIFKLLLHDKQLIKLHPLWFQEYLVYFKLIPYITSLNYYLLQQASKVTMHRLCPFLLLFSFTLCLRKMISLVWVLMLCLHWWWQSFCVLFNVLAVTTTTLSSPI